MNGINSWKTSLAGFASGASVIVGSWAQTGHFDWKSLVVGAGLTALGWFSKDSNVTGGTTPNVT